MTLIRKEMWFDDAQKGGGKGFEKIEEAAKNRLERLFTRHGDLRSILDVMIDERKEIIDLLKMVDAYIDPSENT